MSRNRPLGRLALVLVVCTLVILGAAEMASVRHRPSHRQVRSVAWYTQGIPEQPPLLLVDGIVDNQPLFQRWRSDTGSRIATVHRRITRAYSFDKRHLKKGQLTLAFLPAAPPVTLTVLVYRGRSVKNTTDGGAGQLICSGTWSAYPTRVVGCLANHGKGVSLALTSQLWSEARILVVAALWVPLRKIRGYAPGDNQESWRILLSSGSGR